MSYFTFGLVELTLGSEEGDAHARALLAMHQCASSAGLAVAQRRESEPSLLSQMRGTFSAETAIPFLCVAQSADDTSDRLISPHLLGVGGACVGVRAVFKWAGCLIREATVSNIRIWFTEGFDDAFEFHECHANEAAELMVKRIQEEGDVPSLLVVVRQK